MTVINGDADTCPFCTQRQTVLNYIAGCKWLSGLFVCVYVSLGYVSVLV